ncbi:hypothetical protein [Streptomyces globisporus]|uniref:hypothetical protein n=1 Tax=Streptomyces globisporus TaxID=1908 RepID=UPI00380E5B38
MSKQTVAAADPRRPPHIREAVADPPQHRAQLSFRPFSAPPTMVNARSKSTYPSRSKDFAIGTLPRSAAARWRRGHTVSSWWVSGRP